VTTETAPRATAPSLDGDRLGRTRHHAEHGEITLSLRETRLVVERLLQAQGLHLGAVPAVRDFVVLAQAAGFDALASLDTGLTDLDRAHHGAVDVLAETPTALIVDCKGQSACVVAPALLDLALSAPAQDGTTLVWATGVRDPRPLAALAAQVRGFGARATVTVYDTAPASVTPADGDPVHAPAGHTGPGALITADRHPLPTPTDPDLARLLTLTGSLPTARAVHTGTTIESALWWRLFEASAAALSTESITSLTHAGATAVDEHGRIEPDLTDDHDFAGQSADPTPTEENR